MRALYNATVQDNYDGVVAALDSGIPVATDFLANAIPTAMGQAIHEAAFRGYTQIVTLLLQRGANVNARNGSGHTPLHYAAQRGHINTGTFLITHGARVDAISFGHLDETSLHAAGHYGQSEFAKLLLNHGANRTPLNTQNRTPAMLARGQGHTSTAHIIDTHQPIPPMQAPAVAPPPPPLNNNPPARIASSTIEKRAAIASGLMAAGVYTL